MLRSIGLINVVVRSPCPYAHGDHPMIILSHNTATAYLSIALQGSLVHYSASPITAVHIFFACMIPSNTAGEQSHVPLQTIVASWLLSPLFSWYSKLHEKMSSAWSGHTSLTRNILNECFQDFKKKQNCNIRCVDMYTGQMMANCEAFDGWWKSLCFHKEDWERRPKQGKWSPFVWSH